MCSKLICFELVQKDGEGDGGGREGGGEGCLVLFLCSS